MKRNFKNIMVNDRLHLPLIAPECLNAFISLSLYVLYTHKLISFFVDYF